MRKITLSQQQICAIHKLYQEHITIDEIAKVINTTVHGVRKTLNGYRRPPICQPIPDEEIFVENSTYNRANLRNKLRKRDLLKYECYVCGISATWNNKKLTLQVDHVNGIGTDHRLINLRWLCYNCHTQTTTWGARNIRRDTQDIDKYIAPRYDDYKPRISFRQKKNALWNILRSDLEGVCARSNTFAEILRYFGLQEKGAQYKALKERLFWEGIDFEHIKLGWGSARGAKSPRLPKYSLSQMLTDNSKFSNGNVKIRIFKDGLLENKCCVCGCLPLYNGISLTLRLDHINGKPNDNRIENLRILCPNCHSQTDTFCGKNNDEISWQDHLLAQDSFGIK